MKTKSLALLHSIRVLLALLVLVAFPSSPVLAAHGPCDDVTLEVYYGGYQQLFIEVECEDPTGAYIFWTSNGTNPTHDGPNPTGVTMRCNSGTLIPITWNTTLCVTAIAWKATWQDSVNVNTYCQHNPNL